MKKKRLWLFTGGGLGALGAFALSACGVLPVTPSHEPVPEPTSQDTFINELFEIEYLEADLDVNVRYLPITS